MKDNVINYGLSDVWFCPTTGRVIEGAVHDDKVLCRCGKSNPIVPVERTEQTGVHIKRFLVPATVHDWLAQVDRETRRS